MSHFLFWNKVKQELDRMESTGVIKKIDEPTSWCAGMVMVLKKEGKNWICVDLKPLNECVLREIHPLPKVGETLAQLPGAKLFSKLDANSGFWQIPLAKNSKQLTTFITLWPLPFHQDSLWHFQCSGTFSNESEQNSVSDSGCINDEPQELQLFLSEIALFRV